MLHIKIIKGKCKQLCLSLRFGGIRTMNIHKRSTQANIILNIVVIKMSLTKNCKELSFQTNNITNKEVVL